MEDVIWLSGYPKCGHTWTKTILANVLYGEIDSTFLKTTIPEQGRYIINPEIITEQKYPIARTHDYLSGGQLVAFTRKFENPHPVTKSIHLVRHPLDVALSFWDFLGYVGRDCLYDDFNDFFNHFIGYGGEPKNWAKDSGSMLSNVSSWEDELDDICIVRYEDLKTDCNHEVARMLDYMGISRTDEEISSAVERASFKNMKKMEETDFATQDGSSFFYMGNREETFKSGRRFVNKGQVGRFRDKLTKYQIDKGLKAFADYIKKFGYEDL